MPTILSGRSGTITSRNSTNKVSIYFSPEVTDCQLSGILGHKSKLFLQFLFKK